MERSRASLACTVLAALGALSLAVGAEAQFSKDDYLIVLVKGNAATTSTTGFSGSASLYRATGTATAGLNFTAVPNATDIACERNSTKDPGNKSEYGSGGYVPPGVYFLHYHRTDPSLGQLRYRLGLSDAACGETIKVTSNGNQITRNNLHFHRAFNDLADFNAHVSEGCITMTESNFRRLFPESLFDVASSPFGACPGHTEAPAFGGQGKILVFVTDVATAGLQTAQLTLFNSLLSTLKLADFAASKGALEGRWRAGL